MACVKSFLLWMHNKLHVAFDACLNYIMGCKYVKHVYAKLWMVGLCWALNSNQNTQANIKFYHGNLKRWFLFETKGLRGCCID
jgi:hypothetical protein